jgi:hypothetical protein
MHAGPESPNFDLEILTLIFCLQEDLCVLVPEGGGDARLVSGALLFPQHWSLRAKMGLEIGCGRPLAFSGPSFPSMHAWRPLALAASSATTWRCGRPADVGVAEAVRGCRGCGRLQRL